MGGFSWEATSSLAFSKERRQLLAVLTLVRKPMTPHRSITQRPRLNLFWSQKPTYRNRHRGKRTDNPNCVTQRIRDKNFILPPVVHSGHTTPQTFSSNILSQKGRICKMFIAKIDHHISISGKNLVNIYNGKTRINIRRFVFYPLFILPGL